MDCTLRMVIEKVDSKTNKVIDRSTVDSFEIHRPEKIMDVGLRHKTQIHLLKRIQQKIIDEQYAIISEDQKKCPNCKVLLKRNGYKQSDFHAVFSDHKIRLQKHTCPICHESQVPSIKSLFGTSIHPDLYKLQCEMGASFSFFKSECQLENLCQEKREINNHQRIKRTVNSIGEALFEISIKKQTSNNPASELIVQIDGGHIKDKDSENRSFEALTAKIYTPNAVIAKGKRTIIKDKTCVASAKNDHLKSIKQLIYSAAKRQGMNGDTKITIIADGAKNCWQATKVLEKDSASIETILDWFHISKKFQPLLNMNIMDESTKEKIEQIKWEIWHGKGDKAIANLKDLINVSVDDNIISKLNGILIYLNENKVHLCNYAEREKKGLLFTSHVAESTVEHLINERHKRKQKMQWTRESAHNVLQIRASIASNEWLNNWEHAVEQSIQKAA